MTTLAALAYGLLTLAVAPFVGFLALVTAAALWPRRRPGSAGVASSPRFLFVIPAHDEEAGVGATVASCASADYEPGGFEVVVIADNCADATAGVARAAGARVFERFDPGRRGKGYAMEDFFGASGAAGFDAVVLIDADTVVDPGLLAAFAGAFADGADWSQCYYTVRNPAASWRTRLLTYALSLFNGVWLLGEDRLGLGAGLRGNGMCLSTRGLARHPWRAHGLAEDQEFAWSLRLAGERARFVAGAKVYGEMVSRGAAAVSQRRRWEAGRRSLRGRFAGPLVAAGGLSPGRKALLMVDLLFPQLTSLLAGLLVAMSVHPLAAVMPGLRPVASRLLPWHALAVLVVAAYAVSPFLAMGLPIRYLGSVWALPYFAAWKLAGAAAARTPPDSWVRTPREGGPRLEKTDRR